MLTRSPRSLPLLTATLAAAALFGCRSIGPATVAHDRFNYGSAIADSWKQQMLLNIVKLRYADPPVFLEVASVIDQYAIEGLVNVGAQFPETAALGGNIFSAGGTTRYGNRPTITYQPLYGQRFTRSLLTPIAPAAVFSMVQSGWSIEGVLRTTVRSMNGIGGPAHGIAAREEDPRWEPLIAALGRLQAGDAFDVRVNREKTDEAVMLVIRGDMSESLAKDMRLVRETLGLDPDPTHRELRLVRGNLARDNSELALLTRSMLEILSEMSWAIELPPGDEAEGRVAPAPSGQAPPPAGVFRIHSGSDRPSDAFVAVPYRDHWFWIDDREFLAKRAFSLLLMLGALAESGSEVQAPGVTISAGQ